jgi:hypothetical protein
MHVALKLEGGRTMQGNLTFPTGKWPMDLLLKEQLISLTQQYVDDTFIAGTPDATACLR